MSAPPVVEVEELSVSFAGVSVLDRISLAVGRGELCFIMGPSGCGKTTLLRCMVGLLQPDQGEVRFMGRPLDAMSADELRRYRRQAAMVFQAGALLNSISLAENVALPIRLALDLPDEVVEEAVRMKLAQVGLLHAADRMPSELSGGMRKRAGIARALALDPCLIFLDEPTGGLDPITSDGIDNLLLELRDSLGVTQVVVTHDVASAEKAAERVLVLSAGKPLIHGSWDEVRRAPDPAVQDFVRRHARPEDRRSAQVLAGARLAGGPHP